jgi:type I restriction enzyme S subunit
MESAVIPYSRLKEKNKWVYSAHSQLSLQIEEHINSTQFDVVQLGELVEEIADGLHGVRHYVDDGVIMLAVGNVTEYGLDLSDQKLVTQEEHERLKRSQVQRGDLLVTITGRLGSTLVYELNEPANLSAHVARIKVNEEAVNPYYVAAYLNSKVGKQLIDEFSIGSIYPHINVNRLKNVRVILPPRSLQDQIAQVMQEAYHDRQKKLQQAEQSYQRIIDYVFEQLGINLERTQRKRNALVPISVLQGGRFDFEAVVTVQDISSQFAEHETTLLEELVEQTNERITPSIDSPDEIVNYIGLANIQSNTGELVNFEPVQGKEILSSSPKFAKGDILFGRMRPYLNKVWIAEFDSVCSGEALVFRPNKNKVDTQFLHTLLLSQLTLDQVVPLQSGSSLPRVSASDVLSVKLPAPKDLQKQQEIGNEVKKRRSEAKRLRNEAEAVVTAAKARVERMILGEETVEQSK